jgi:hypothetical protein
MRNPSNYALRLPKSLKAAAERLARAEGTTLNQLIVTALAAKVATLETTAYFAARARAADLDWFDRFMAREGGAPPGPDDVLPRAGD